MPLSHHLNQCWVIVNWTLRNKFQRNINWNTTIFIQENAFGNVVWKMAAILSHPQCVNCIKGWVLATWSIQVWRNDRKCKYNAVPWSRSQFSPKSSQKTPHSSPARARYGVSFWGIQILIYTSLQSLQWCMQCHVILDRVIMAPDGILLFLLEKLSGMG